MSRKDRSHDKLPPFVPLFRETLASSAYRQLSFGARALFTALRSRCVRNNGHVYLSQRDVGKELGHKDRGNIANWYRELQHYGFIVQTEGASLGVDGKGMAPHWLITDMPTRKGNNELALPTKDFLRWDGSVFEPHLRPSKQWNARKQTDLQKQNPGRHVATTVDAPSLPALDGRSLPLQAASGSNGASISADSSGSNGASISRLATVIASPGSGRRKGGGAA